MKESANDAPPIQRRSLQGFSKYYLNSLKGNLESFGTFFLFVEGLFWIQVALSVIVALFIMNRSGFPGALQLIILGVNMAIIIWFAILGRQFVRLQTQKIENDIYTTIEYRAETVAMANEILKRAEQKAENKITVSGGNAVFAIDGSTISGVNQTITVEGNSELVHSLALLVSFCEESGNAEATKLASKLSEEATKYAPSKGILFDLWSGITALLPEVAGIVKIAQGIKSLFV